MVLSSVVGSSMDQVIQELPTTIMVKVSEKHSPNSAKFGRACSKNKQMRVVGGYFDRLPSEILHNIVLMLPFASIIQLRRSSKFLYNCLTDAKFIDLQLTHALQKSHGYLFTVHDEKRWNYNMYIVEPSGGDLTTSEICNYSYEGLQSSGGLMCAYSRESKSFRVFNPHISEEVQVLNVPKFTWWFFSYSPSTKEYKILKIGVLRSENETGDTVFERNVASISTLGSNIWREIQNVPYYPSFDLFTECQGKLFWVTKSGLILLFDLVSEKFHEIPGPTLRRASKGDRLINLGDTVGYVYNYGLWVLEDKTKGIWINKYDFSIPPMDMYPRGLIGVSGNGGLFGFMENSTKVFSQDMSCTNFRAIEIKLDKYIGEVAREMISFIGPHVRSLVSPVRVMEMGNKQIYDHSDLMDISLKRKWILETLKLDHDASEDDLFNEVYKFMRYTTTEVKPKRRRLITTG
ncbi:F-box protein At3g07870-like [Silene latifolia]|uniref:F-box protein At3g07870-like n=1 Tax=Silene latifolia TaxID=37657 RepID=UPI003D780490